jgi:DNA-binding transcriptional MerR regulator
MSLDPQPTYTTAQVHLRLGVPKPTLRNWSGEYAAFLSDRARPNGGSSRRFTADDLVVLNTVRHLTRVEGLADNDRVRELLREGFRVAELPQAPPDEVSEARKAVRLVPVDRLGDVWNKEGPTGVKKISAFDVYDKISSLSIWLRQTTGAAPSGLVIKNRISAQVQIKPGKKDYYTWMPDINQMPVPVAQAVHDQIAAYKNEFGAIPAWGETFSVRLLPHRIPRCDWAHIRRYMQNPPSFETPAEGETPNAEELALMRGTLTPEQKLILEGQIAATQQAEREARANRDKADEEAKDKLNSEVTKAKVDKDAFIAYAKSKHLSAVTGGTLASWLRALDEFKAASRRFPAQE